MTGKRSSGRQILKRGALSVLAVVLALMAYYPQGNAGDGQVSVGAAAAIKKYEEMGTSKNSSIRKYIRRNADPKYIIHAGKPNATGQELIVKYTFADMDKISKRTDTINEAQRELSAEKLSQPILGQVMDSVAVYELDEHSDYYAAMAGNVKLNGGGAIIDHEIAKMNNRGEEEQRIKYDDETGIVYIPKKLVSGITDKKKLQEKQYQIQLMTGVSPGAPSDATADVIVENRSDEVTAAAKYSKVKSSVFDTGIRIPLITGKTAAGISNGDIEVYINDEQLPLDNGGGEAYAYDRVSGMLTLNIPAVNIASVRIVIKQRSVLSKLFQPAEAVTSSEINVYPKSMVFLRNFDSTVAREGMQFKYSSQTKYNASNSWSNWADKFKVRVFNKIKKYVYVDSVGRDGAGSLAAQLNNGRTWNTLQHKDDLERLSQLDSKNYVNFAFTAPHRAYRSINKKKVKVDFSGFTPSKNATASSADDYWLMAQCAHISDATNVKAATGQTTMTILKIVDDVPDPYVIMGFCTGTKGGQNGACVLAVHYEDMINVEIQKKSYPAITDDDDYWSMEGAEYALFNKKSDAQAVADAVRESREVDIDSLNGYTQEALEELTDEVDDEESQSGEDDDGDDDDDNDDDDYDDDDDDYDDYDYNDDPDEFDDDDDDEYYEDEYGDEDGDDDPYEEEGGMQYEVDWSRVPVDKKDAATIIRLDAEGYGSSADSSGGVDRSPDGKYYVVEIKAPSNGHSALSPEIYEISESGANSKGIIKMDAKDNKLVRLKFHKRSLKNNFSSDSTDYELDQAVYRIYKNPECRNDVNYSAAAAENSLLITNAEGDTGAVTFEWDDDIQANGNKVYVREEVVSKGHNVDGKVYAVDLEELVDEDNGLVDVDAEDASAEKPQALPLDLALTKINNDMKKAENEGDTHLENAQYEFRYTGGDLTRTWIFKTDSSGRILYKEEYKVSGPELFYIESEEGARAPVIPAGHLEIRETEPSEGFLKNTEDVITADIVYDPAAAAKDPDALPKVFINGKEQTTAAANTKWNDTIHPEMPMRGDIYIEKWDKELDRSEAMAGKDHKTDGKKTYPDLNGIRFTIRNVSDHDVIVPKIIDGDDPEYKKIEWHSKDGIDDAVKSGDAVRVSPGNVVCVLEVKWNREKGAYEAHTADSALPYGRYEITETGTNSFYELTDKEPKIAEIRENGTVVVKTGSGEPLVWKDHVYRQNLKFEKKAREASREIRLAYIPFRITNDATGHSIYVVTNKNGEYNSSLYPHDRNTNGYDEYINNALEQDEIVDSSRLEEIMESENGRPGSWFGWGEDGTYSEPDNGMAVFPYGEYTIEEIRCTNNQRYEILEPMKFYSMKPDPDVSSSGHPNLNVNPALAEGINLPDFINTPPVPDKPETPMLSTTAADSRTNTHKGEPDEDTMIIDKVEYENLIPGREYTIKGTLMSKDSEEPVTRSGRPVTAEKTFAPDEEDGMAELEFRFDSRRFAGKTVVVFEDLYIGNSKIAEHSEITNAKQSVEYSPAPAVKTDKKKKSEEKPVTKKKKKRKKPVLRMGKVIRSDTGDESDMIPAAVLCIGSAMAAAVCYGTGKRRRRKKCRR